MTQTARLIAYLRSHHLATSLEITLACEIVNVTGRISDARAAGHVIVCGRRSDGRHCYTLVEQSPVAPLSGEQVGMAFDHPWAIAHEGITGIKAIR